jgi:crossover junction endodeoxyribonuclease RusA
MIGGQVSFFAAGIPQPKGSTKAFMPKGARFPVVTSDNTKLKPWGDTVKIMAQQNAPNGGPWSGPIAVHLIFHMPRPKSLPRKVLHHLKKPDTDKLIRGILDALKGVFYVDDSQVVEVFARKVYHERLGVHVTATGGAE